VLPVQQEEAQYLPPQILPFACTTISLPGVMLNVVFPCPGGIANGTANGPTPAIMSATTSGGSLALAAALGCAAGSATSTHISIVIKHSAQC
jgi:hypothetical protein